jgi:Carboxypeptidase regulatory-like domain
VVVFRRLILIAGLVLAVAAPSLAQARLTGADLAGTVTDQTGSFVPGCTIAVTNLDTNVSRTVITDARGEYRVPALPLASYAITATLAGFKTQTREGVDVSLGQAIRVDFTLLVGAASETVTVDAIAPIVSPTRTEISAVINQHQIDSLPINLRNFIGFALITPGVNADRTPLQGAAATSGLSFTGQRGRSNNVMVDGLDNNDPVLGSVRATFSQQAVREFQVLVDSYSAEFGKASGGVVNIVTKSGTNVMRGDAFFYFRDKLLNARKYFDKFDLFGNPTSIEKPPFSQRQWGGTFGGPVEKNKTFAFLSFERSVVQDTRFVAIDPAAADVLNRAGFPVELGNVPLAVSNTSVFGKFDHHWTASRALAVRANYADVNQEGIDDYGGIVARSRGTVLLRKDWSISAAETDVLSNRWINELRGQFAYEDLNVRALDPLCNGACDTVDEGGPTLEVTGVAAVGRQRISPVARLNKRVQLLDTVSYFSGAHHIKFGGEFNYLMFPSEGNLLPANVSGRYFFSPIPALGVTSSLDALKKGIPAGYAQGYGNPHYPDERYHDLSLFAQDQWTRGRLVIKPGVRYQVQYFQSGVFEASDVGGGTIRFPLPSDYNNIAPRVGVSYDVTGKARTIVHGSYGLFYDNILLVVENPARVLNGRSDGLRTLFLPPPLASIAWNAPGHRLTEAQGMALLGGSYVSAVLVPDPALKTPFTHQTSVGVDQSLTRDLSLSVNAIYVRGFNLTGTLEYNPVLPATLGPSRRPNDVPCTPTSTTCVNGGVPGTSTSVIQFTSFGESWYRGLTVGLTKRMSRKHQYLVSYTLSKAEDTSTDYQSSFIVQTSGAGRNPRDQYGLPVGFDPRSERGPATHDQRHRLVVSGVYQLPWHLQLSGIITAGSGRPFTPLAGADLNGDGNGGQFPPDRARRNPADEATSVGRNSETTAGQLTVDLRASRTFKIGQRTTLETLIEAFNLFNRVNFIEDTNQSSFVIFGSGAFPSNPLPAYGRYTLSMPPRQVQLAARFNF